MKKLTTKLFKFIPILLLFFVVVAYSQTSVFMQLRKKGYVVFTKSTVTSYTTTAKLIQFGDINGYFAGWALFDSTNQDSSASFDSLAIEYQSLWRNNDSSAWETLGNYRYANLSEDGDTWITWATNFDGVDYQVRFLDIPACAEAIYIRPTCTVDDSGAFIVELFFGMR